MTIRREDAPPLWAYGPIETPIGLLYLYGTDLGLRRIQWAVHPLPIPLPHPIPHVALLWARHLEDYFHGQCPTMEGPLDLSWATPFARKVYVHLRTIPYGKTQTYGEVATAIGHPKAARAVGRALARNPMPIVIPCHRVVAKDGSLHGYSGPGGQTTKAWLLEWERRHCSRQ